METERLDLDRTEELERQDHKLTCVGIILRALCDFLFFFSVCS